MKLGGKRPTFGFGFNQFGDTEDGKEVA